MGERRTAPWTFIDTFSSFDDLKGSDASHDEKVFAVARACGRGSCFEFSERPKLWATLKRLEAAGRLKMRDGGYPWTLFSFPDPTHPGEQGAG